MVDLQTIGVIVAATSIVLYITNLFIASQKEERNKKVAVSMYMMQILFKEDTSRSARELWDDEEYQRYWAEYSRFSTNSRIRIMRPAECGIDM